MNDPETRSVPVAFSILNFEECPLHPPNPAFDVISISALNGRICGPCEQHCCVSPAAGRENVPAPLTLPVSHDAPTISDQENSEG
jgi:hypothetical protein